MNRILFLFFCLLSLFNSNAQMDSISISAEFGNQITAPEDSMTTLDQIIVSTYVEDTTSFGNLIIEVSDTTGMNVIARMNFDKNIIISNNLFSEGVITTNVPFLPTGWLYYKITAVVANDTGALTAPVSLIIHE